MSSSDSAATSGGIWWRALAIEVLSAVFPRHYTPSRIRRRRPARPTTGNRAICKRRTNLQRISSEILVLVAESGFRKRHFRSSQILTQHCGSREYAIRMRQFCGRDEETAMALHIEDPATERIVRELASRTGETVTVAIRHAVEE